MCHIGEGTLLKQIQKHLRNKIDNESIDASKIIVLKFEKNWAANTDF